MPTVLEMKYHELITAYLLAKRDGEGWVQVPCGGMPLSPPYFRCPLYRIVKQIYVKILEDKKIGSINNCFIRLKHNSLLMTILIRTSQ